MATDWGFQPPMRVGQVGVGAGGRDIADHPNVVRILAGWAMQAQSEQLVLVETTIDDLDPRAYPDVLARTKHAGALEAWLSPVIMKHGRPGVVLTALCPPSAAGTVTQVWFRETPTLGIRYTEVSRRALDRDFITVTVGEHQIRVKRGWLDGRPVTIQPEYRDAQQVAEITNRPIREILQEAQRLAGSLSHEP
jgi:uncharacterized protein (DUF111 family)